MDYKEKYNTALERARDLMTNQNPPAFDKHLIEMVFPELKESRDERIKREILELVSIAGNGNQFEEIKDWLEQQGEKDPCIGCTNDKGCVTCVNGNMKETKFESTFKIGDWFVNNIRKDVFLIKSFNKNGYCTLEDIKGNIISPCLPPCENDSHIWSIEDAKDGDVLTAEVQRGELGYYSDHTSYEEITFIYIKTLEDLEDTDNIHCCCYVDYTNSLFLSQAKFLKYLIRNVKPATKEQRENLFTQLRRCKIHYDSKNNKLTKLKYD